MMIFVVPRLTSLYSEFNAELPLPTRILMGISDAVIKFWPVTVAFFWVDFMVLKHIEKLLQEN